MTSVLANLAVDAHDPRLLADFWCAALGWTELEQEDGVLTIGPADGSWPVMDLIPVPEAKTLKNRLHLDLRADDSDGDDARADQASEVARLLALGARHADVGQGPDVTWVVLADPEGNEFCVLQRTVSQVRVA